VRLFANTVPSKDSAHRSSTELCIGTEYTGYTVDKGTKSLVVEHGKPKEPELLLFRDSSPDKSIR
jgi:hypothetical protein